VTAKGKLFDADLQNGVLLQRERGSIMGVLGYKTSFFGVPASVEAGYKALRYNVGQGGLVSANATLNGPFIGLTGYW